MIGVSDVAAKGVKAPYRATAKELEGIDRGLKAAREGRFATDEEVKAILAKPRGK
jgi:predicted transcriptional regulator